MAVIEIRNFFAKLTAQTEDRITAEQHAGELLRNNDALQLNSPVVINSQTNDPAIIFLTNRFVEAKNNSVSLSNFPIKSSNKTDEQDYLPKAVIIPLKENHQNASYQELSRRVVQATLEANNIKPSNIELEEIMALPHNRNIDMNLTFGKNWQVRDLPGLMPLPAKVKDVSGREVFGYKMTLSPKWQAGIIADYQQVRGELAKPENINRRAVVDMQMSERLKETFKIAWEKGYISDEVKRQLGNITPEEAVVALGLGGAVGIIGTTEVGSAALGPVGFVLTTSYLAKTMMDFDPVAEGAARAVNRQDLDKPAAELGKWLGGLAKDGALTVIGAAGGLTATKAMPPLEKALSNKSNDLRQVVVGGVPNLGEPIPAASNGSPIGKTTVKEIGNNEPLQMTASDYKDLRKKTPSKEIRDAVNPDGPKIDPVYKYYVERLEADHIVSMKEVTKMPGFEDLTKAQQIEVLNLRDNFLGLGKSTNASKGAKTWADWAGHKQLGDIPPEIRSRMLEIERQAKNEVQKAINERLP